MTANPWSANTRLAPARIQCVIKTDVAASAVPRGIDKITAPWPAGPPASFSESWPRLNFDPLPGMRRRADAGGFPFWLAPPEYVILRKLLFHRERGSEQHLRDIRAMPNVSGPFIDRAALSDRAVKLGLHLPF